MMSIYQRRANGESPGHREKLAKDDVFSRALFQYSGRNEAFATSTESLAWQTSNK
jgi:hypothetical protein